jgi:hypothetical protein
MMARDRMPSTTVVLDARFQGFEGVAFGGYTAGVLAAFVPEYRRRGLTVALRSPPPVDRSLRVDCRAGEARLLDGDLVVARAVPWDDPLEAPPAPSPDVAADAGARYPGLRRHAYPTCFGCGPAREPEDGLRVFVGPLPDRDLVAGLWRPPRFARHGLCLADEMVWAALDCPGAWAHLMFAPSRGRHVTRRLSVRILDETVAEEFVVAAWLLAVDGPRKRVVGSALFDQTGCPCAVAQATWVALDR